MNTAHLLPTASTSQSLHCSPTSNQQTLHPVTPQHPLLTPSTPPTIITPPEVKICSLDQLANPPLGQQPNYPWWTIIRAAIMGSQYGILNRQEIYQALEHRWQYFRTTDHQTTRIWKSAVGHNLSVKECFVRVHVEGGGNISYYIVDTAVDPTKGRLSKTKNLSASDRMPIPTISRKVVLPANFNLSIRARWSPAIAAIRNAKYGLPCHCSKLTRSRGLTSSDHSEVRSQSEDSSESDDGTETEGEQVTSLYPPNSRLGSSLNAIIDSSGPRRLQSIPRLAFSRSLSNALVAPTTPPSIRRRLNSRSKATRVGRQAAVIRPPISRIPDLPEVTRSVIQPLAFAEDAFMPFQPGHPSMSESPPGISSLQDQVNAALADVAAKLPEIADQQEESDDQRMMIDMDSSIFDALPEIDLGAIFQDAQALEIQDENRNADDDEGQKQTKEWEAEGEPSSSLLPTTADFDRLLASVIPEFQNSTDFHDDVDEPSANQQENLEQSDQTCGEEELGAAGLEDLLQNLIDQATSTEAQNRLDESDGRSNETCSGLYQQEENVDEDSARAFMEASKILEKEIEEAIKLAEEQEMARTRAALQQDQQEFVQMTLAEQISPRLTPVVQLTPSGDIPVHPLPPVETSMPSCDHQPAIPVSHSSRAKPKTTGRTRPTPKDRPTRAVEPVSSSSQQQQLNKTPASRPSLLSCLPDPITTSSTSSLVDRRTRASGARTFGKKLNLPLPSSHTTPNTNLFDSSFAIGSVVDAADDGSSLAPKFLESIQTVSLSRPNCTFPELAKEALLAHPDGKLTAAEIFKVLEKKYPYFVTAPDSWKATLRNVLTSHSCFVKIPRPLDAPGRGDWWSTVDLPLWKRRRTTAKAKQDEDFIGRYAREQTRKTNKVNNNFQNLNNNHNNNVNNCNLNNCNIIDENSSQVNNLIQC